MQALSSLLFCEHATWKNFPALKRDSGGLALTE